MPSTPTRTSGPNDPSHPASPRYPVGIGRERRSGEHPARLIHRRSDMNVFVSVDAPVDADRLISHDSTLPFFPHQVSEAPPAGTADTTVKVVSKAAMKSRPPDRSVRASSPGTKPTDQQQGTKPVTPRVRPRPEPLTRTA